MEAPYKGLEPYDTEDRERFFGREDDQRIVIAKLFSARLTLFFGITGAGKSSLLRAGMIPQLIDPDGYDLDVIYHSRWNPREDPRLSLKSSIKETLFKLGIISSNDSDEPLGWKKATLQDFLGRYDVFTSDPLVIIIDQFEEFFLYHADSSFFSGFIQELSDTINDRDISLTFLVSMREDFLAELDVFWDKVPSFFDNRYRLEKLTREQAREAIVRPVEAVNFHYEPELVEQLLNHLSGEESDDHDDVKPSLRLQEKRRFVDAPYLQIVCKKLWEDARANQQTTLTRIRYKKLGGSKYEKAPYKGIVQEYIETVISTLTLREQGLAFEMFQYLVTRRGTKMAYLDEDLADTLGVSPENVRPTLDKLAKSDVRILRLDNRPDGIWYELYHDIFAELIQGWTEQFQKDESRYIYSQIATATWKWQESFKEKKYLLRGEQLISAEEWLQENPDTLSSEEQDFFQASLEYEYEHTDIRTRISGAFYRWIKEKQDENFLLKGVLLTEAEEWAKNYPEALSQEEKEFLKQSHRKYYRGVWIRRGIVAVIAMFAVIATMFGLYANKQREEAVIQQEIAEFQTNIAKGERNTARSRQLAAQINTLLNDQLDLALLLSVEAVRTAPTVEARNALLDSLLREPHISTFLDGHTDNVLSVAFSEDGRLLASGSVDSTVRLWDIVARQPIGKPLKGHTEAVLSVAFSPDTKLLASGSRDNTIRLWDVATGETKVLNDCDKYTEDGQPKDGCHTDDVVSVAFSPNGRLLASGSWDTTIRLWDVATGQPIGELLRKGFKFTEQSFEELKNEDIPEDVLDRLGPLENEQFIAEKDFLDAIKEQIGVEQTNRYKTLILKHATLGAHEGNVESVAFSPDGVLLASGGWDSVIRLWDVATGQPGGYPLEGHTDAVLSVAFSPDGTLLASGGFDNTIRLWDVATRQPIKVEDYEGHKAIVLHHPAPVMNVNFSPDSDTIASIGIDKTIILWKNIEQNISSSAQPDEMYLTKHAGETAQNVQSIAFSPKGELLASGCGDNTVCLWNVTSRLPIGEFFTGNTDTVETLALNPEGTLLASGGWDDMIHLWDVATGEAVGTLEGHKDDILTIAFSPDGTLLASGGWDQTIRLWDVATGEQPCRILEGHTDTIESVAFSPDGKLLASGGWDQTIRLWDIATGDLSRILEGHTDTVMSVAFSPDKRLLASGSADNTIHLWDVTTGEAKVLKGHTGPVESIVFSSDGELLASSGDDQSIILWDVAARQSIGKLFAGHTASVKSVAFRPDGKQLISGGWDQKIILWNLDPEFWLKQACRMANRNLSKQEWQQYFPDEDYRKICVDLPTPEED